MIHRRRVGPWVCLLGIAILIFMPAIVHAKSAYVVAHHSHERFQAWNINPDGTLTYQYQKYLATARDPAGIGIYDVQGSEYMYISGEFKSGLEIWDPVNHNHIDHVGQGGQLGGVDVHTANKKVYAVGRQTNRLHSWDIDPADGKLSNYAWKDLGGTRQAYSIALDESRDTLWVADSTNRKVRSYDVSSDLSTDTGSFTPNSGHTPIDIAVDSVRNTVYSVSGWAGQSTVSAYDVNSGTEKQFNLANVDSNLGGVGIAVDEVTGYLYLTTGFRQGGGRHELLVMDPAGDPSDVNSWLVQETDTDQSGRDVIGSPAGIAIGNVSYNPLDLQKSGPSTADLNGQFDFTISLASGTIDYSNCVLTDQLCPEMTFVSCDGGGVYDAGTHSVAWTIGDVLAGDQMKTFTLTIGWNGALDGQCYTNFVTLDSDQLKITRTAEVTVTQQQQPPIPEPLTMISAFAGIAAMGGYVRRRRRM